MSRTPLEVWELVSARIAEQIKPDSYATWFKPITPIKWEDNILTVQVPSQFFYEWLEQHYSQTIQQAMTAAIGPGTKLLYSILMDVAPQKNDPILAGRAVPAASRVDHLNMRYTFESFIEGECNKFDKAARWRWPNLPALPLSTRWWYMAASAWVKPI